MINWHSQAWEDYLHWQNEDKRISKRINALIKDIQRSPFDGTIKFVTVHYSTVLVGIARLKT
ncbi:MAG: type II toxin-antitoxin system YoeB family toxin [Candidatus Anammoxibacter sp.]